ncbi:CPBP family intramembrane glutamic endopeptidase [Oceanicella sp. SM1341]|uniref:CPBP family intramembrane glutamic endopeptidase n=1 Tax=Oceanicella sp. SM1341 TaxID=1548889 RepID=UPI000E502A02|nr:CPBP family intramembrane glutamic endopeptidase [Oceanicella sp. SM1341]
MTGVSGTAPRMPWPRWIEFLGLFVAAPMVLAFALPPSAMWSVLGGTTVLGICLLFLTPGFEVRALFRGGLLRHWRFVLLYTVATTAVALLWIWLVRPSSMFSFPRYAPDRWLMVMALYPFLSALPQELLFRALYFRRYGHLIPHGGAGIVVNGAIFAAAHLMYWNVPAVALTFLGGCIYAWAYERKGSFPLAFVLHSLGGQIMFTTGMGTFFYHGAVPT